MPAPRAAHEIHRAYAGWRALVASRSIVIIFNAAAKWWCADRSGAAISSAHLLEK